MSIVNNCKSYTLLTYKYCYTLVLHRTEDIHSVAAQSPNHLKHKSIVLFQILFKYNTKVRILLKFSVKHIKPKKSHVELLSVIWGNVYFKIG